MAYMRTDAPPAGLAAYAPVNNWAWEMYPPPYNFLAPAPSSMAELAPLRNGLSGLGCGSCSGTCGGCSSKPAGGLGIFDSTDIATWGVAEWGAIVLGLYIVSSIFGDTSRAVQKVGRATRRKK